MNRTYGAQSMVGRLRKALVHRPGVEFSDVDNYRRFGFTGESPVLEEAQQEHDQLVEAMTTWGVEIVYLGDVDSKMTGSTYVTDNALITDYGAIVSRVGKQARRGEEARMAQRLTELGIPILYTIQEPGTFEGGGETIWLDHETLLVGHTYRTNTPAYEQMKSILAGKVNVIQCEMPHYKGPGTVLHLGSVISMIDHDLCVGLEPLMPISMVKLLNERGIKILPILQEEFATSASNVLAVAPRKAIMIEGNPVTKRLLEENGVEVKEITGKWTGYDRCAGPTCMSMSLLRNY